MVPRVTVLTSGTGLGVYIPGLLVARGLARRQVTAEVLVVEDLLDDATERRFERNRQAFHRDFALALMGHRMPHDMQPGLDPRRLDALLARWRGERRRYFVNWSGFWLPILARYRREVEPERLSVDLCRIDAEVSASFKIYGAASEALAGASRDIWLWSWEQRRLLHELPVAERPPLAWHERRDRLVAHGGGWGIGTYRERARELSGSRLALDLVVHDPAEAGPRHAAERRFMVAPDWRPWRQESCSFPPFGEVDDDGRVAAFSRREEHHEMFELVRESRAILSKPGGGTLIDSLAAATPVVLLEPFGYAEESNARIWEHLGFGIRYERWRDSGFAAEPLAALHRNLLTRRRDTIDYPADLAARVHAGAD